MAFLQASEIAHATEFTLIELYGGAHLTFYGDVVAITTVSLVGDDTSYIHIPPQQLLRLTEVSEFHCVGQCILVICKVLCSHWFDQSYIMLSTFSHVFSTFVEIRNVIISSFVVCSVVSTNNIMQSVFNGTIFFKVNHLIMRNQSYCWTFIRQMVCYVYYAFKCHSM